MGDGRCISPLEAEALEGHVEMAQVERRVEQLGQLSLRQSLANLGTLPDGRLEVRPTVECAEGRSLDQAVRVLP
jgi:hypothetical protein